MKNTQQSEIIKRIIRILIMNATRMGLSDLTLQNMITTALESNPGTLIKVSNKSEEGYEGKRCKYHDLMPHHPLPNSTSYARKKSRLDQLCALFGKIRREDTGINRITNGKNVRANRYVRYQMNLLGQLRDNGNSYRYWKIGMRLMSSSAFQAMAFNYVCWNWHSNMSIHEVNSVLKKVNELSNHLQTEITLRRVYIPKANGKIRPLGVPNRAWRVYLHMFNVLVVWYRTGTDKNQHAYFPGRGVHTAWQQLLKKLGRKNIYEFDLNSFFPSVCLKANERILREVYGIPSFVTTHIDKLNRSITRLTLKDKIDESADRKVLLTSEGKPNPNLPPEIQKQILSLLNGLTATGKEWLISSVAFRDVLPEGWSVYKEIGVPQGAATSCGLATLNLHDLWQRLGDTLLMYADDGLVFPPNSENPDLTDKASGISQNVSKSGWVKKDGEWLKPLKFLGLEYIPPSVESSAKLRAKTRNGSTKEFGLDSQLLVSLLNEKELMMWLEEDSLRLGAPVEEGEASPQDDDEIIWSPKPRADTLAKKQKECSSSAKGKDLSFLFPERSIDSMESIGYMDSKKKGTRPSNAEITLAKETYESVKEDYKGNSLIGWLNNAASRLINNPNPLSLLFEGRGLCELASMYCSKEQDLPSNRMKCKKGSWAHTHLGGYLFDFWTDFLISSNPPPFGRVPEIEDRDFYEYHFKILKVWKSIFRMKAVEKTQATATAVKTEGKGTGMGAPNPSKITANTGESPKAKSRGETSARKNSSWSPDLLDLRRLMVRYLRSVEISIHNLSTLATSELLANHMHFDPPGDVAYCYVNKPDPVEEKDVEPEVLEQKLKKRRSKHLRKLQKEFKQTFGCFPRKLLRIPPGS